MPHPQIAQVVEWLVSCHDERINAASSERASTPVVREADARVLAAAGQDEANSRVRRGAVAAAGEHKDLVEVAVAGLVVGHGREAHLVGVASVLVVGVEAEEKEKGGGCDEGQVDCRVLAEVGLGERLGKVDRLW